MEGAREQQGRVQGRVQGESRGGQGLGRVQKEVQWRVQVNVQGKVEGRGRELRADWGPALTVETMRTDRATCRLTAHQEGFHTDRAASKF